MHWLFQTDAGLLTRICIGAAIFATLAAWDLARLGRKARRWREYLFLLTAIILGIAYGTVNDAITSSISWEYFYYFKGVGEALGPKLPPDLWSLHWGAMKVGMKAAGSAGAIVGVAVLLANNPTRRIPGLRPLSFRRLAVYLAKIAGVAVMFAAVLGAAGYFGKLAWLSKDLADIARENLFRPPRFHCVFGIHLGGYVGGLVGTALAVWSIRKERKEEC